MFAPYLTSMAYWLERTIDKMSLQQYIPSQLAEKKTFMNCLLFLKFFLQGY